MVVLTVEESCLRFRALLFLSKVSGLDFRAQGLQYPLTKKNLPKHSCRIPKTKEDTFKIILGSPI